MDITVSPSDLTVETDWGLGCGDISAVLYKGVRVANANGRYGYFKATLAGTHDYNDHLTTEAALRSWVAGAIRKAQHFHETKRATANAALQEAKTLKDGGMEWHEACGVAAQNHGLRHASILDSDVVDAIRYEHWVPVVERLQRLRPASPSADAGGWASHR